MAFDELITQVLTFIESNLEEKLTLDIVANQFHMSKFYFHRIFTAFMGKSLSSYVATRRLNAAVGLIKRKELSLTDIAYQLNFSSQAAFTRAFKQAFGISPKALASGRVEIEVSEIPQIARRDIKNFNGDLISNFNIVKFQPITIKGVVFQIDLSENDFKTKIRFQADQLMAALPDSLKPWEKPCYMIYSDCMPGSSKFNVIFGIEAEFESPLPNVYPASVPELLCVSLNYKGDLLEIGDLFATDALKFLKITRLTAANQHIELIQRFNHYRDLYETYDIFVPITPSGFEEEL